LTRTREVSVLVHRGREVLVLLRAIVEPYWHVVAGGVEDGESYMEAAERELLEATGLEASGRVHSLNVETAEAFAVQVGPGWEPRLNEEHSEYRWCSFDAAVELVCRPDVKESLRILERRLPQRRRRLTLRRPRTPAVFFLRFPSEEAAAEIGEVLREDGYAVSIAAELAHWLVSARGQVRKDSVDVAERALADLAAARGGAYAGYRRDV
jgi:dihydroneopterin triphosphate diphosphatase